MHKKMAELVVKQLKGDISEEEIIELNHIRSESGLTQMEFEELQDIAYLNAQLKILNSIDLKASWKQVVAVYFEPEKESVWQFAWREAAIMVLGLESVWKFTFKVAAIMILGLSTWLCWQLSSPTSKGTLTSKGAGSWTVTTSPDRRLPLMAADKKKEQTSIVDSCINFEDSDLQSIIHQLPGGGDYEVEYAAAIPRIMYTGALSRTTPVDALVQLVQLQSACLITLEGKKIMVHF